MNELRSLLERCQQAALIRLSGTGNVEGGAVVDGGADDRQTDRDIHPFVDAEDLQWAVPLVMIHRNDNIEVSPAGPEKEGVRGQRSLYVPSVRTAGLHCRLDFRCFLAAPEKTGLAC